MREETGRNGRGGMERKGERVDYMPPLARTPAGAHDKKY